MEELMKLALADKWDEVIEILRGQSPILCDKFLHKYIVEHNKGEYPYRGWTEKQRLAFKELDSSVYRTNYYLKKGDDNLTNEEWGDLRSCDF